ncbi:type VI secretion system-associated protein TagF [Collimonas silvisoli]|uniref:type VI secretion system-associated protein TagF n=1 Tax=Collimonas silvisoli TaxID=2825884 RepID=UPI001B8AB738|nr:type VI secretion system-associated protein TagF [Collimonas silvisoli]
MSLWLPQFLQDGLLSPPALWGKLPSRGDFIRHQLKHNQGEALQAWIAAQLRSQAESEQALERPEVGHAELPWCFVLPPGSLPFAVKQYVIGVWMASSDKVGRQYPLVMMQTAAPRWIREYFSRHAEQPCDWLFAVARALANTVRADKAQCNMAVDGQPPIDHLQVLMMQIDHAWQTMRPDWRQIAGRSSMRFDARHAQAVAAASDAEDPVRDLDGVRYLPWADWPQRLTRSAMNATPQAAFWQQDLKGRFVAATTSLRP